MFTDTPAASEAIVVGLCLKKEKHRRWIKEWYKRRPQYTCENLVTNLMLSELNAVVVVVVAIRRSVI
jgi:hypothetical protein